MKKNILVYLKLIEAITYKLKINTDKNFTILNNYKYNIMSDKF